MNVNSKTAKKKKKYIVKKSRAGLGLFAVALFKKGEFVIEYIGERLVGKDVEGQYNKYLFEINDELTIDGSVRSNVARYINHSCRPNCEVRIYAQRVRIWTIKRILPGEQFSYDYGKEYFDEYIKPKGCKCASCRKKAKK
jgi:uncharacterized protein